MRWKTLLAFLIIMCAGCKPHNPSPATSPATAEPAKKNSSMGTDLPLAAETSTRLFTLAHLENTLLSEQIFLPLLLLGNAGKNRSMSPSVDMLHCELSGGRLHIPIFDTFQKTSEGKRRGASVAITWNETLEGFVQVQLPVGSPDSLACGPGGGGLPATVRAESVASFIRTQGLHTEKGTQESYLHGNRLQGTYRQIGTSGAYTLQIEGRATHTLQRNKVQEAFSATLTTPVPLSVIEADGASTIQSGSLAQTTSNNEIVSVDFKEIHYPSPFACQPDAGLITGRFTDAQSLVHTFTVSFSTADTAGPMIAFQNGETSTLELPFRCR